MAETEEFFSTPEAVARLDLIRHLIENSELVPLVRGPSGSGKTLLASRLQSLAPENWVVCHFSADAMMQPERLLAHIARCSGLPDAQGDNLARLNERFELLRKHGSVPVLLVDDAQSLPPTSLITLLRLYERQIDGAPLVSLVLFANEEIDKLLSTPQLQIMSPQAVQVIDLPLLTREEADAFMNYLFNSEGLDKRYLLDDSKLTRLYRETGGVPGLLASAILNAVGGEGESTAVSFWEEKKPLIYRVIPVAIIALVLLVFQGPINRMFESDESAAEGEAPQVIDIKIPEAAEKRVEEEIDKGERVLPSASITQSDSSESLSQMSPQTPSHQDTKPIEDEAVVAKESIHDPVDVDPPLEPVPRKVPEEKDLLGSAEQIDAGDAVKEPVDEQVSQLTLAAGKMEADPGPAQDSVEVETDQLPPVAASTEHLPETDSAAAAPNQIEGLTEASALRGKEWMLSQPAGNYTVQLLAAGNIDSIQRFIDQHGLSGEAFTMQTQRKGKPWYPLLWGTFPDRASALDGIKRLPPAVQTGGAWARSFASLRE
ncbi:MAG: AAA family ATPase [Candidatus Thiodiazotropha sp. (ex Semelilucina semeliformis)]|nr:AAA family ATPase [Candidatus Thiodiazotropha sp. (ex Semelilucina semeliformis)]